MGKWRLFRRTKPKDEGSDYQYQDETKSDFEEQEDSVSEQISEENEGTYVEYKETLYSEGSAPSRASDSTNVGDSNQRIWRDVSTIEKNIDNLKIRRSREPESDLDKTVDKVLSKIKKK